jgi:hypothetical protein
MIKCIILRASHNDDKIALEGRLAVSPKDEYSLEICVNSLWMSALCLGTTVFSSFSLLTL